MDNREAYLASLAVAMDHQKARALGLPRYYMEDGYLIEEKDGRKKRLAPLERERIHA